ncbi:MAG: hypothetical protein WA354_02025 [Terracidiphilus sp.]
MSEERNRKVAKLSLMFAYAATFGVAAWRAIRQRSTNKQVPQEGAPPEDVPILAKSLPVLPSPSTKGERLDDLSPDTPGNAPLDRLARRGARDEENTALLRPGGGIADPKAPLPDGPSYPWTHASREVCDLLERQSLESKRLTGWSLPMPERLPVPTCAPAVMALGVVTFAMGLATTWYVCLIGSVVFAVAAWRWTGELQGE